jgi:hypothetical protein
LRGKQLAMLPDEIYQTVSATQAIDLFQNEFNIVPTEVLNLKLLRAIDLGNNQIKHLQDDFVGLMAKHLLYPLKIVANFLR